MNHQFNNNTDNNDQHILQEEQFRQVFFDQTSKRVMSTSSAATPSDANHIKRARLDSTTSATSTTSTTSTTSVSSVSSSSSSSSSVASNPSTDNVATTDITSPSTDPQTDLQTPNHHTITIDAVQKAVNSAPHNLQPMFDHQSHPSFISSGCITPSIPIDNQKPTTNLLKQSSTKRRSLRTCKIRKYRSRSLPNIIFQPSITNSNSNSNNNNSSSSSSNNYNNITTTTTTPSSSSSSDVKTTDFIIPPPLPPVNIQSLKEIDLSEILKNPQLRHDILFDPQLQFRPNLDGERGRRKKITYERYWNGVKEEIKSYYSGFKKFNKDSSRLPTLFLTLREILISLLPSKDKQSVIDILDIELIMQQLNTNSLDFISLSKWLSNIFKSHCAPMRDPWVDEMNLRFQEADENKSVDKLIEGLRMIFTILEAMKLDVANHQIRILRPVLVETAVEFERDYFLQMISRCKLDIQDSINWFKSHHQSIENSNLLSPRQISIDSILSLLSCSKMVSEFPSSLAFDHSRLIVLRANVRQLVCLELCIALYRQLVVQNKALTNQQRLELLNMTTISQLKKEVLAIVTDEDGNVKWTRNIGSIALQLVRRSNGELPIPKDHTIDFAFNWLIKQTQPSSSVYSLMESKIFKSIKTKIEEIDDGDSKDVVQLTQLIPEKDDDNNDDNNDDDDDDDDISALSSRIALLYKFHWSVFGSYYIDALN